MRNHLHILFLTIIVLIFTGCQDDLDVNTPTSPSNSLNKIPLGTGALGDRVWNDLNQNGIQDNGEPGIAGLPVGLFDCDSNQINVIATDETGHYLFDNLEAGTYVIKFEAPAGYKFTMANQGSNDEVDSDVEFDIGNDPEDGKTGCITLAEGQIDLTWDAGVYLKPLSCQLGDFVWNDLNQNGIQDNGEPGIAGLPVGLFDCELNQINLIETDETGHYLFDNLEAGTYIIKFEAPAGYKFTMANQGSNDEVDSDVEFDIGNDPENGKTGCITLTEGQVDLTWDAGVYEVTSSEPSNLGNRVWYDKDKDGIQDFREKGIRNVKVDLFDCFGNYIKSTSTNYFGYYYFKNIPAGSYKIKFNALPNYTFTMKDQGNNDERDSDVDVETGFTDCIVLEGGKREYKWDAGLIEIEKVKPQGYGYWKTHSKYGPAKYDPAWGVIGEDTEFFHSGKTWFQVIRSNPRRGNVYYILAHQYIAARLNVAAGVFVPESVIDAINKATELFEDPLNTPEKIGKLKGYDQLRRKFLKLANLLNNFNEPRWFSRFFHFN
jgi:hypothetical protein